MSQPAYLKCYWADSSVDVSSKKKCIRPISRKLTKKHLYKKEEDKVSRKEFSTTATSPSRHSKPFQAVVSLLPEERTRRVLPKSQPHPLMSDDDLRKLKSGEATIRDLSQEERQRIAQLISELASVSEEKEKLQSQLQEQLKLSEKEQEALLCEKSSLQLELSNKESLIHHLQDQVASLSHRSEPSQSEFSVEASHSTNPFLPVDFEPHSAVTTSRSRIMSQQDWYRRFTSGDFSHHPATHSGEVNSRKHNPFQPILTLPPISLDPIADTVVSTDSEATSGNKAMQEILLHQQKQLDEISQRLYGIFLSGKTSPGGMGDVISNKWSSPASNYLEVSDNGSDLVLLKALNTQPASHASLTSSCSSLIPTKEKINLSLSSEPTSLSEPSKSIASPLSEDPHLLEECCGSSDALLDIIDLLECREKPPSERVLQRSPVHSSYRASTTTSERDLDDPMLRDLFFLPGR